MTSHCCTNRLDHRGIPRTDQEVPWEEPRTLQPQHPCAEAAQRRRWSAKSEESAALREERELRQRRSVILEAAAIVLHTDSAAGLPAARADGPGRRRSGRLHRLPRRAGPRRKRHLASPPAQTAPSCSSTAGATSRSAATRGRGSHPGMAGQPDPADEYIGRFCRAQTTPEGR